MPEIATIFGLLERLQSVDVTVDQNRCVMVRNRNAECSRCADACTSGCITRDDGLISVSPENCIGCGTCATVCPTCALEAHHPDDRELFEACVKAMQNAGGDVVIVCERMLQAAEGLYDPEKVIGVKCLGRVEESLIVLLARAGASRVLLVKGGCDDCRQNPGSTTAALVCATANTLLEAWGQKGFARICEKMPSSVKAEKASYDAGKRGFLTEMFSTAKEAASATAEDAAKDALGIKEENEEQQRYQRVQKDGTLPHFVPHRRNRLLKGLSTFGEPEDVMVETRLWGHVIIDPSKCTSCQMCATFCPTEAIKKFKEDDGTFGVDHFPCKCVKCRCCESICPADAITISDEVFAVDLVSRSFERYEMAPRAVDLGPHQMLGYARERIKSEYVYER